MREFSQPEVVEVDDADNLTDAVFRNAAEAPDDVAFLRRSDDGWAPVSMKDFASQVRGIAAGLVAAGVQPGDRVGLMSRTRFEWTLVDYAIWTAGAVTVPIYETSSAEQVAWILADSGAVAVVVESERHAAVVAEVRAQASSVRDVWQLDAGGVETLVAAGQSVTEEGIETRRRSLSGASLATIIYTSGTTGRPKGCELTHMNMLGTSVTASKALPELFSPDGSTLLFLPLAHVFGRLIQTACVQNRVRMGHTADVKNLIADLGQFQPTFLLSVPRVFEKLFNTAQQFAAADPNLLPDFADAVETAIAYSEALQAAGTGGERSTAVPAELAERHARHDGAVYATIRSFLGGRLRYAVSGGAPLGARLGHFFRGAGITVLEGYGLTETTASGTVNTPTYLRIGTVGRPGPGCGVRIADDGEILLRGRHVFQGYYRNPEASQEVLSPDGWFRTGDIGQLDDDGYLTITGRKKELIVTAGGKNVAPAVLEDRLRAHPLVSQCLVVGDRKPFIACLVTIDPESWAAWKTEHAKPAEAGVADLATDPDLLATIQAAVDEANKAVSKAESIRRFTVLDEDFTEDNGTLTPSMKVKRAVVLERFAEQVDALYSGARD